MSTSTSWSGSWLRGDFIKGDGVSVDCVVKSTRVHSVFLTNPPKNPALLSEVLPSRFNAITVEFKRAWTRALNRYGTDIDPDTPPKKNEPIPQLLDASQLLQILGGKALPPGLLDSQLSQLHPNVNNTFEFWADMEKPQFKAIATGDEFIIRTLGNSIFVDKVERVNSNIVNMKNAQSSQIATGWGGKIMSVQTNSKQNEVNEGVDDDEWDD